MLRRLLSYRPGLLTASVLAWTATSCLPIITGLIYQHLFDILQHHPSQHRDLWLLFGALGVLAVTGPVLMLGWFFAHLTLEATLEALVRTNLYSWLVSRSGRRGSPPSPVTALGHLRDDVPGYTKLVNEWYRLSGEAVFVVIALIIMLRIDPLVTALTFLPLTGVMLFTYWMRARLPQLWGQAREATTAVTEFIADAFAGVQTVKAAGAEPAVLRRLAVLNDTRRHAEVRSLVGQTRVGAVIQATTIAGRGLVLLVAAGAMLDGRFSVGDFVLFATYLDWMLLLPRRIGRLLSQRKTSDKSLQRLRHATDDAPAEMLGTHRPIHLTGPLPPLRASPRVGADRLDELVADDLSYTHPGTGRGISHIHLRLRRGTVTVLTGEVGSGKSTLLEVLLGLKTADSGQISWNGHAIDPATVMRPPRVAYKPQTPRLFSESLRDTMLLGLPDDLTRLDHALHRAAFDRDVAAMPDGLDTMVGARGVRLSGGQVQRASAARMFIRGPELYVIDDLSSALDDETEQQTWQRTDTDRTQATYLIVSHRPAALHRADHIIVLHHGQILAAGTLSELRHNSPVIRRILGDG